MVLSELMKGELSHGSTAHKTMIGGSLEAKNRRKRWEQLARRSGLPRKRPMSEATKKGNAKKDPLYLDFLKGQKPASGSKKTQELDASGVAVNSHTDPTPGPSLHEAYVRLIDIIVEASKSQKRALKAVAQSTKHADYHDEKKWRRSPLGSELLNPKKARLPWKKRREIALAKRDADDAIKKKRAKSAKERPAETDQEKDERIEQQGRDAMRVR